MLTGADTLHSYPPVGLPFLLVNNYGPTECTVVTTSGEVHLNGATPQLPSIGSAIANTQVYILDQAGKEVPPGTAGELHVGGLGVARGYRNRKELTAERFIPNPFDAIPGGRLFKTGDLARLLPDGQIAFLGRIDEQVKVRGFRIEPSEVAAALNQHPQIQQSLVMAQAGGKGETRLIGYFVAAPQSQPTLSELREFLGDRLPDYMVPAAFVRLEKLPLTGNGKIDRKSLPAADEGNTLRDRTSVAPQTDMEKTVAGMLERLLELKHVDVNDNFFSLGGHSLLGAQLIARVRDTFGIEMPLRAIFEAPSVVELSAEIDRLLDANWRRRPRMRFNSSWNPHPRSTLDERKGMTAFNPTDSGRKREADLSLFRLLDPAVLADPYPLYHRLREEDPVHWDPDLHSWCCHSLRRRRSGLTRFFGRANADGRATDSDRSGGA